MGRGRPGKVTAAMVGLLVTAVASTIGVVVLAGRDGPRNETAWERLLDRQLAEGVTVQLALDAFATMVAPVPGGRPVAADELGTRSVTPAVWWMVAVWDELGDQQRQAYREAVHGGRPAQAAGAAASRTPLTMGALVRALPAAQPGAPAPGGEDVAELQAVVDEIAAGFTARTGGEVRPLPPQVVISPVPMPHTPRALASVDYRVSAAPAEVGDSRWSTCVITLYPGTVDQEDLFLTLAHEVYHCHQYAVLADAIGPDTDRVPELMMRVKSWIREGSAEWAGYWYAGEVGAPPPPARHSHWPGYFEWPAERPGRSLFKLSYPAVGFFAVLHDAYGGGRAPWVTIDAMLLGEDGAAFALASGATDDFLRTWATTSVRDAALGPEWFANWPSMPGGLKPPDVDERRISGRGAVQITVDAVPGVARGRVQVPAEVEMLRIDFAGHGALHWGPFDLSEQTEPFDAPGSLSRFYCLHGECACPGPAPAPVTTLQPGPEVVIAVAGGAPGTGVTVVPLTVEEFCADDSGAAATRPVESCDDVLAIVQRHNSVYTTVRDVFAFDTGGFDDVVYCEVSAGRPAVVSDDSRFTDPGLIQRILVFFPATTIPGYQVCGAPEGFCTQSRTVHHPGDDRIPATSVVYTVVSTRHVELEAEEERHRTPTPPELLVRIALEIEAGIPPA